MHQDGEMTLTFRCPPELEAILPPPMPAVQGLPDWFKKLPQKALNPLANIESQTVKRCPPVIDAMTFGFLMPLACDLRIENGEISWAFDPPHGSKSQFVRSPISFHDGSQVEGSPFHSDDRVVVKFHNFWTIEAPPGYSVLLTHPMNRPDLPFTTISGLVDADLYSDNWVNFPAVWHDIDFQGVLPKGTPIAQCIPVKREDWKADTKNLSDAESERIRAMAAAIRREPDIYRHNFRVNKR